MAGTSVCGFCRRASLSKPDCPCAPSPSGASLLFEPPEEQLQRRALAQVLDLGGQQVLLLSAAQAERGDEIRSHLLRECWTGLDWQLRAVLGEPWTEPAFLALSRRTKPAGV